MSMFDQTKIKTVQNKLCTIQNNTFNVLLLKEGRALIFALILKSVLYKISLL